jgi:hypothetical protein
MDYSQQMLARAEHNLMLRSLPAVSENGNSNRVQRKPARWLRALLMSVLHLVMN